MTIDERVQVKNNFMSAYLINEIGKWIFKNSRKEFLKKAKFSEKDFFEMISLKFDWTMFDVAKVSELLGQQLIIVMPANLYKE